MENQNTNSDSQDDPHSITLADAKSPPSTAVGEEAPDAGEQRTSNKSPESGGGVVPPPGSDLEKKFRRAERFGMSVQLSEEEKRSTRGQRFGTGSTSLPGNETGKLDEQKRKARAERFGLVQQTPADEEAKKKARLARFSQNAKPDAAEEEKMKARAARFSQPPSTSLEVNGKAKSDLKTKAGGEGTS